PERERREDRRPANGQIKKNSPAYKKGIGASIQDAICAKNATIYPAGDDGMTPCPVQGWRMHGRSVHVQRKGQSS
ncbi:hypothetical protein, partial [uncultured Devosia sp.]|uniref:hypothetical protein n=1 Tax=uncultured Devosia sp. TaxID=211434 RepID=UPI00260B87D7